MNSMTTIKPTVRISQEQIDFFHREGYLVLPSLTTPEEVERLKIIYDRLFTQRAGRDQGMHLDLAGADEDGTPAKSPQILKPNRLAPELNQTLYRANAAAVAEQLFGPEVESKGEHMIYKPAHFGAATPWHQDQAYHSPDLHYRNVNFWMPLQEANEENGCLRFVPGSHKWDVKPHHIISPEINAIEIDNAESYQAQSIACPIPAGGVTLHHSYLLHYAGPNTSSIKRRAYILKFGLPHTKRKKPVDLFWLKQRDTSLLRRRKSMVKSS